MMINGNFFNIIYFFIIISLFNSNFTFSQSSSLSIGSGLFDAKGYNFKTKPVITLPIIEHSINFPLSNNDRHWGFLSTGYRKKGVSYSYSGTTVEHYRGYLYYALGYKYSVYIDNTNLKRNLISVGIINGKLFWGSKSIVNGKNTPISYGRKGFRNWSVYIGVEQVYNKMGYSIKLLSDISSFNPSSFNNDPKIYFYGIEVSFNYYFY